jgi:polygalacturonase
MTMIRRYLARCCSRVILRVFIVMFTSRAALKAQNTRSVSEPKFPVSCIVLKAQLSVSNGEPLSETLFDTSRIQSALDNCASGQAVELTASNNDYGFLIQPINIPSGVTLLVDAGVTAFASRSAADYQQGSGATCGVVSNNGGGCRPLITSKQTTGSGIMGYGVIDGRGWDNLIVNGTVQNYSWYSNTQRGAQWPDRRQDCGSS